MSQICPRCNGLEVSCPICGAPPKHISPPKEKLTTIDIATPQNIEAIEFPVNGVDISGWNGTMNIAVTKQKAQYGFIRLGYGDGWKDARCDDYRRDALANDWPYGVYWYCQPGRNYNLHAEGFAEIAEQFPFQLDVVIDAEQTALSPNATLDWLVALDNRLQQLMGEIPIIYTAKWFWDTYVARSSHFSKRPNWIANWTLLPTPALPIDLQTWKHWQWSADNNLQGPEYGSGPDGDADMDLNRFNGTVSDFNTRYGTHITALSDITEVPEPPEEETETPSEPIKSVYVTAYNLNVRSSPGNLSPEADIGTLRYGSDVSVFEEKDGWYRIAGWISSAYTKDK